MREEILPKQVIAWYHFRRKKKNVDQKLLEWVEFLEWWKNWDLWKRIVEI